MACLWGTGILIENAIRGPVGLWVGIAMATGLGACAVAGSRLTSTDWGAPRLSLALLAMSALTTAGLASAIVRSRPAPPLIAAIPATDRAQVIEGTVLRPPEALPGRRRTLVEADRTIGPGALAQSLAPARLIVTEPLGDSGVPARVLPGDRVRFAAQVRAPRGYGDEGAFDRERFLRGRGIDGLATVGSPGLVRLATPPSRSAWRLAAVARERVGAAIDLLPPGDGRALVNALVLGRRGEVRPGMEDAFRRVGVTHVLSVSGLHLAAVALLIYALMRRLWLAIPALAMRGGAERAAALAAVPAAVVYTLMTGAEVATVRAAICAVIVLGGAMLGRRTDALTALAAAALIILIDAPWAIFEPSFQLSFAAAAALSTVAIRWSGPSAPGGRLRRALAWLGRSIVASTAASLATAPLTALHFGAIQPAGVLTNLVVVPVAELAVLPLGLAGAIISTAWAAAGAPLLALAALVATVLGHVVGWLATGSPVLTVPPPRPIELVIVGAGLTALAALRWRRAAWVCGTAAPMLLVLWLLPTRPDGELRVTFLDVGHGDATLIETPGGEVWLVDAGGRLFGPRVAVTLGDERLAALEVDPGAQAVFRFLQARRIHRLDLVVITHPHPDHAGGLAALIGLVPIGEVWIGGAGSDRPDPAWEATLAALTAHGVPIRRPTGAAAAPTTRSGVHLQVLWPRAADGTGGADPLASANDNSLVLRVEYAGRAFLFAGDVERRAEAALVVAGPPGVLAADVVKVPHHGSRSSSSEVFVAAASPRLAVVSCDGRNGFGFPAAAVVARWQAAGALVAQTDRDGAVTVRVTAGGNLTAAGFRSGALGLARDQANGAPVTQPQAPPVR